jgi:hypothetical protein
MVDKHLKLFLGAVIFTSIILILGLVISSQLETKIKNLEVECAKKDQREITTSFTPICDVKTLIELERESDGLGGTQALIVTTHRHLQKAKTWPYLLSIGVLVLTGLPWAWYFLLRRIRELRNAIAGK